MRGNIQLKFTEGSNLYTDFSPWLLSPSSSFSLKSPVCFSHCQWRCHSADPRSSLRVLFELESVSICRCSDQQQKYHRTQIPTRVQKQVKPRNLRHQPLDMLQRMDPTARGRTRPSKLRKTRVLQMQTLRSPSAIDQHDHKIWLV